MPSLSTLWGIVDLDGTISDCSARVEYALRAMSEPDVSRRNLLWDEFHARCLDDPPHFGELVLVQAWVAAGGRVVYITGRHDKWRSLTHQWLARHNLPPTPLFMRSDTTRATSTAEYKENVFRLFRDNLVPGDRIVWAMEDQDKLVALWRSLGISCLQPRPSVFGEGR